jgi:hypothetical protein
VNTNIGKRGVLHVEGTDLAALKETITGARMLEQHHLAAIRLQELQAKVDGIEAEKVSAKVEVKKKIVREKTAVVDLGKSGAIRMMQPAGEEMRSSEHFAKQVEAHAENLLVFYYGTVSLRAEKSKTNEQRPNSIIGHLIYTSYADKRFSPLLPLCTGP